MDAVDPSPKERVELEIGDLQAKLAALDSFIQRGCPGAGPYQRILLVAQAGHMRNYAAVLVARLLNWGE